MADLHTDAFPETLGGQDVQVRIRRLDDIFSGIDLAGDILLKLDVQGAEDQVLAGATQVLAKSQVVISEVSFDVLYQNQPLFAQVHARLRKAGFAFHGTLSQLFHPGDGRILQADAIFLRDPAVT
jgi:hypothetical protein